MGLSIVTPSDKVTTSWLCAQPTNGLMPPSPNSSPPTPTSATLQLKFGTLTKKKNPGTESSKSTQCSPTATNSPWLLSDGPQMVTLVPKDPTTAQSEPTFAMAESSLMPTTRLASTLASTFQAPTLKSCLDNMSTKLAPQLVLILVTTFTCPDTFSAVLLRTLVSSFPLPPSSSPTGMDLAATPTSPPQP